MGSKRNTPPEEAAGSAPADVPGMASDLDQLRDILYGNQARVTEQRLTQLDQAVDRLRRDLTESFNQKIGSLADGSATELSETRQEIMAQIARQAAEQQGRLQETRQELTSRLDKQGHDLEARVDGVEQALVERVEKLSGSVATQLRSLERQLQEQLQAVNDDLSARLLAMQAELRARDDDLRQEFLTTAAWLDQRKVSRQELGQMLIAMGQALQEGGERGGAETAVGKTPAAQSARSNAS